MDASFAAYQARLATFAATTTSKARRTSNRSKKAAPKSKSAWPHASPSPEDIAFAGFVWKPTSTSPDNVQCFSCACQLDGWEEEDVPAFEHLTHSPNCGFAIVTCIRLRNGDPGRTEDDPSSSAMVAARRNTFGDNWPYENEPGYPNADQMAAAGWMFDPADDTPDGVTCPYCSLALDAWDVGDDPHEEHRRRAQDCLFFALTELYRAPTNLAPAKKGKAITKAKRASTRSSTSSISSVTSKTGTRGKKRGSDSLEPSTFSEVVPAQKRGKTSAYDSDTVGASAFSDVVLPAQKTNKGKTRASNATETSTVSVVIPATRETRASNAASSTTFSENVPTVKKRGKAAATKATEASTSSEIMPTALKRAKAPANRVTKASTLSKIAPTAMKRRTRASNATSSSAASEVVPVVKKRGKAPVSKNTKASVSEIIPTATKRRTHASNATSTTASSIVVAPTRNKGKKRASDAIETSPVSDMDRPSKRFRSSSFSSLPDDLLTGTPKKTPTHLVGTCTFEMSSFPEGLPVGTPKKTPSHLRETRTLEMSSFPEGLVVGTPKKTPTHLAESPSFEMSSFPVDLPVGTPKKTPTTLTYGWEPTDLDAFFAEQGGARVLFQDVIVDCGLDSIVAAGSTPAELHAAVMSGLTQEEKAMTVEQWVLYNAKRGEEKLRAACEMQIQAFDAECRRALATLEAIKTV